MVLTPGRHIRFASALALGICLVASAAHARHSEPPVVENKSYSSTTTPTEPPLVDTNAGSTTKAPASKANAATSTAPSAEAWSASKAEDPADQTFRMKRIGAELLAATVGGGTLGLLGGLGGLAVGSIGGGIAGLALGEFAGALAGTMFAGYGLDGNGSILSTMIGLGIGMAVGAIGGVFMAVAASGGNNPIAIASGVVTVISAPVLGAMAGYEFSSDVHRPKKPSANLTFFVSPASIRGGALAGVSASF